MQQFYAIMHEFPRHQTLAQSQAMDEALGICLKAYKALAVEARRNGKRAFWRVRPKFHQLQHLTVDFMQPMLLCCFMFSNYRNESFMGLCRGLIRHGHKRTVAQKALERFSCYVWLATGSLNKYKGPSARIWQMTDAPCNRYAWQNCCPAKTRTAGICCCLQRAPNLRRAASFA